MKVAFLTTLLLVCAGLASGQDAASDARRFRETRDRSFRDRAETPLTGEDFLKFKGLEYFEVNEKFVVRARFEKTTDEQIFMMPSSVGAPRKYFKRGVLRFELDGRTFSLTAFQSEAAAKKNEELFVPFRDSTNGAETYSAGRYLYAKVPAEAEVVLDFNLAFNPNCAYGNEQFACAIPPRENFLQIEIKAGEKIYGSAKKQ